MFGSLIKTLEDRGRGIHGYGAVAQAAYACAAADPARAVAYYLLGRQAEDFVDINERMPVPAHVLDAMFERFSASARALDAAYEAGDAAALLDLLNRTALDAVTDRNN
ncbi:hypothetical protein [Phaeovulum sp. NW3]|uniref:hypothetical protein n=1 Tax=Phaeovulum sp. NW3 TaxID=2934933 RepID=UPI0020202FFB|nr:hypothetical protein [Phaeovulum sp. NW3]MCL7466645.1 hypothetical protein [Phaeovulum sp. NW3]